MDAGKRLLLIGGGGHCRSILDCVLSRGLYEKVGIVDFDQTASALGVSVVGTDDALPQLLNDGWTDAFISVGSIGSTGLRRKLYKMIKIIGFSVPSIIDPTATISREVIIDEGVFIGKGAIVNTGSRIGTCVIINTGAIIEHDCEIGTFAHVSPRTILCGQVSVGDDTHVGAGSVVRQGIKIGACSVIGIGSVVVKDITDNVKAYGNPCRVVE